MAGAASTGKTVTQATEKGMEPYQKLVERLGLKAEAGRLFEKEEAFELARQAVNRITQAETADELFDASENSAGLQSMGDNWEHLNNPINLVEVNFRKSDTRYEEGTLGVYAVVNYITDQGTPFVVGCGAANVVAFLEAWERLPDNEKVKASRIIVREKATSRGSLLRVFRAPAT